MPKHIIYVMGGASGVGKSTVCMGLLAQLLDYGFAPEQLAYIKPVTQCVAPQAVVGFCQQNHIACQDIGSLVFKKGFSKAFIAGKTKTTAGLMSDVQAAILAIGRDKDVLIIDGVGDPAVGSVVGISNVDVALTLPCRVLFVGKVGIGAALDNTVLCVSYMRYRGLSNLGIIYNKLPAAHYQDIKQAITKRLPDIVPEINLLGFLSADDLLESYLENDNRGNIAAWFSRDVRVLDWLDLKSL